LNFFLILKVANIRCFILIAIEIFKISYGNTSLFYFLESSKESNVYPRNIHTTWQWTHSGNCLLMKMAQIESWKNKHIDGFYTKKTQKGGFSKLCVKIRKRCYTDLLHFSTCKHNLVSFFRPNRILTVELHHSFLYSLFFFRRKP
jgi:hypothetical protein